MGETIAHKVKPCAGARRRELLARLNRPQLYLLTEIIKRCRNWRQVTTEIFTNLAVREDALRKFPTVPYADLMGALCALHDVFEGEESALRNLRREEIFEAYENARSHATGYLFEKL